MDDNPELLPVRFYLGGEFVHWGNNVSYVGGDEAMSFIERDKVSLPEITGHLKDHMNIDDKDEIYLQWLFPGKELNNGLRMLSDDTVCTYMSQFITVGGVADIYAEVIHEGSDDDDDESNYEDELEEEKSDDEIEVLTQKKDVSGSRAQFKSPDKSKGKSKSDKKDEGKQKVREANKRGEESDDSDGSFGDVDTSEDDEEARENRRNAKMVKKGVKRVDDICQSGVLTAHHVDKTPIDDDVDPGNDTPYFDSSEEASYDEEDGPEITGRRRKSKFPRFDNTATIPIFSVGMRFDGRNEFKEAVVKYGLAMKRHIAFPKDEKNRIRAKCSWKGCPWMIYGALRTKSDWFQVQTYVCKHRCPQRRDNKLRDPEPGRSGVFDGERCNRQAGTTEIGTPTDW